MCFTALCPAGHSSSSFFSNVSTDTHTHTCCFSFQNIQTAPQACWQDDLYMCTGYNISFDRDLWEGEESRKISQMLHDVSICTVFFVFKIKLSSVLNLLKGNVHITVAAKASQQENCVSFCVFGHRQTSKIQRNLKSEPISEWWVKNCAKLPIYQD